jgi:hypothetical protein
MLTPPSDLDPDTVAAALAHWGLHEPQLEYLPLGFGSHHWRAETAAGRLAFVTVDEASEALERAFRTARALRDAGLEFVLAPLPDASGTFVHRVAGRYAVSVTPFVDGSSSSFGDFETKDERRRMAALVGRLHAAGERVPAGLPHRDDLTIPDRAILEEALASVELPWRTGPFAEPARALVAARADELRRSLLAHDERAARLRDRTDAWVVTHGEPHRANVLVDTTGAPHLVDWDTTLAAPRERDLWHVLDEELTGWQEYRAAAGDVELDREALEFYRRRWELADVAAFVAAVRRPHEADENTAASFGFLRAYLSG